MQFRLTVLSFGVTHRFAMNNIKYSTTKILSLGTSERGISSGISLLFLMLQFSACASLNILSGSCHLA